MRPYEVAEVEASPQATAVARATLSVPEIGPWFGATIGRLAGWLAGRGVPIVGPPFARYHFDDPGAERFGVEAGFPIDGAIDGAIDGDEQVVASSLPGGSVAVTVHVGPYEDLPAAYDAVYAWVTEHGGQPAGDMWEVYETDPDEHPDPSTWRTRVFVPFRSS
jgi:effector-binding domain-containing protein